jgi:DNA-binding transcriptional ArsR family regulator
MRRRGANGGLRPPRVRRQLVDAAAAAALADTFRLLGDVTRVRLLDALAEGERCVQDLAGIVELSESAVSHQLRLLRTQRIVRPRRAGRQVFYSLDDRHIAHLFRQARTHVNEKVPGTKADD